MCKVCMYNPTRNGSSQLSPFDWLIHSSLITYFFSLSIGYSHATKSLLFELNRTKLNQSNLIKWFTFFWPSIKYHSKYDEKEAMRHSTPTTCTAWIFTSHLICVFLNVFIQSKFLCFFIFSSFFWVTRIVWINKPSSMSIIINMQGALPSSTKKTVKTFKSKHIQKRLKRGQVIIQ